MPIQKARLPTTTRTRTRSINKTLPGRTHSTKLYSFLGPAGPTLLQQQFPRRVDHAAPEDTLTPRCKRKRKANRSPDNTLLLVQLYKEHASDLYASFKKPGVTHKLKKEIWEKITQQVNLISSAERSREALGDGGVAVQDQHSAPQPAS